MKCSYCGNKQAVLIKLPITFDTETVEAKLIKGSEESICLACIVYEMFEIMTSEREEEKEEKKEKKKED